MLAEGRIVQANELAACAGQAGAHDEGRGREEGEGGGRSSTCGLDESRQSSPNKQPAEKVAVDELKMPRLETSPAMFREVPRVLMR